MDFEQLVWIQHAIGKDWEEALDPVIWTAVDLLDSAWRSSSDYLGSDGGGSDQDGKYAQVGEFLVEAVAHRQIFVSAVSLDRGAVVFTDGRHRFVWLRDHGLRALPVEVSRECLKTYSARFETAVRVGRFVLTPL
jgi:hypothetical protein